MNVVEASNRWKDGFRCLQFLFYGDRVGAASITSSFDASPLQGTRTFCKSAYTWLSSLWGGFFDHFKFSLLFSVHDTRMSNGHSILCRHQAVPGCLSSGRKSASVYQVNRVRHREDLTRKIQV